MQTSPVPAAQPSYVTTNTVLWRLLLHVCVCMNVFGVFMCVYVYLYPDDLADLCWFVCEKVGSGRQNDSRLYTKRTYTAKQLRVLKACTNNNPTHIQIHICICICVYVYMNIGYIYRSRATNWDLQQLCQQCDAEKLSTRNAKCETPKAELNISNRENPRVLSAPLGRPVAPWIFAASWCKCHCASRSRSPQKNQTRPSWVRERVESSRVVNVERIKFC